MRVKRRINEDTVVVGSPEWRSLSHSKRREIIAKRSGAHVGTVTNPEMDIDDIPEEEPKTPVKEPYTATMRHLTHEEYEALPWLTKQSWRGHIPEPESKPDADQPGDVSMPVRTPGAEVTEVREREGYKFIRTNPHGHWSILGLPKSFGSFVTFKDALAALTRYLKETQQKDE
jgi:hypothetical protein